MKKFIFASIVIIIVAVSGVGFYIYNNFQDDSNTVVVDQSDLDDVVVIDSIKKQQPTSESIQEKQPITKIKSGSFAKFDPAHFANGEAVIYETDDGPILKFENFETPNGPDLFVYLASNSNISGIKTERGKSISLGELKQIKGDQVYKLPNDYEQYGSIVIWCRAFDINFSAASLRNI